MSCYVIVDLEMCNVPDCRKCKAFHWGNELIQIGAVMLDDSFEISDQFMTFVSPQFGVIDKFIERLTGISRRDVSGAPSTRDALELFAAWLPEDAILVSWSENDELQIRRELRGKSIAIPGFDTYLETWEDCQKTFGEKMDSHRSYKLSEALLMADIEADDGAHDALVDAKNTARLFAKMKREKNLKLNRYLFTESETVPSVFSPFADLLAGFSVAG